MSPTRHAEPRRHAARVASGAALSALALVAGCGAPMEIFSDASDSASRVTHLAWFLIILSAIVYAGVMLAMVLGFRRHRDRLPNSVDLTERGTGWIIFGGAVMPAAVLLTVFLVSMTAMAKYPAARPRLTIHLDGHQWWWNASYEFAQQSAQFHTANEIHIPVGKTVRFLVTSKDVIHSFWVPQLQGKMDLIPGDTNDVRILARKPGTYRGQCAEFCGQQHARMGIVIVADDSATFERWVSRQLADGSPPRDSLALEGQHLFVSGPCAMCHTVRGTPALADVAPDLTHLASRGTIAAGTLPNTPGNLEAWIANAQALKPGVKMPAITQYDGRQLRAIAAYLGELK